MKIHILKSLLINTSAALALLATSVLTFPLVSSANEQVERLSLSEKIEAIRVKHNVPAVGIAIIKPNQAWHVETFGYANLPKKQAITKDAIFRFASISKIIPAIAILQLQEQGKLSLTDKLRDVAPSIQFKNKWQQKHPLLVQHLLEHTTGWGVDIREILTETSDEMTMLQAVNIYPEARTSRWPPGSRHAYSNTGPVIAARVVEIVSGMTFDDYIEQYIFKPLNMNSSTLLKPKDWAERGAKPHKNGQILPYEYIASRPSSTWNASMADMAKLINMFLKPDVSKVLAASSVARMQGNLSNSDYQQKTIPSYAFAHQVYSSNQDIYYGHNGGLPGAISAMRYNPTTGAGFALSLTETNGAAFGEIRSVLNAHIHRKKITEDMMHKSSEKKLSKLFIANAGYYQKINLQSDITSIFYLFTDTVEVGTNNSQLTITGLMNGYQVSYTQSEQDDVLVNKQNHPVVALALDPIAGEVLVRNSDIYKKISAWVLFSKLALLCISIILIISSVFYMLYCLLIRPAVNYVRKKDNKLSVNAYMVCGSTLLLLAVIVTLLSLGNPEMTTLLKNAFWLNALVFIISTFYPILAVVNSLVMALNYKKQVKGFQHIYLLSIIGAHVIFATYLVSHHLFAVQIIA